MEEHHKKQETITIKKDTLWKIATFVFAGLFLLAIFGVIGGDKSPTKDAAPTQPTNPSAVNENVKVKIEANDPVLGDTNADISIVEFSDFQCPFCARAHDDTLSDFEDSDYFKNGEVNLVYKQFPLTSIHQYAQKAAEASLCANDQGKFWEYHDMLFANQQALDINSLKQYASDLGLDTSKFNNCLDNGEQESEVNKESGQAVDAGGRGTPYFVVVNNKNDKTQSISGAVPFAQLESAINSVQ